MPYFRQTFIVPRGTRWFDSGLIIESAPRKIAERSFARLNDVLPYVHFDLLSKLERSNTSFRHIFRVRHPLGGLRLLLRARKNYDLVVFFAAGKGQLHLCRIVALLVMRPKLFFVFNEFGDGFWLNRENWPQMRSHLERRYQWKKRRDFCVAALNKLRKNAVWLARLPGRIAQGLYAGLLFLAALSLLALLRLVYDTRSYRFRFFSKTAAAPRRKTDGLETPHSVEDAVPEQAARDAISPR